MQNIKEIVEKLTRASELYYNDGNSNMTDSEFDLLKDELNSLDPTNDFLKQIGSPIARDSRWEKVSHKSQMRSLNKVASEEEFLKWAHDVDCDEFVLEEKLDGVSISLEYEDGKLIQSASRGDGYVGEDILENVIRMNNVKKNLGDFTCSLRGEIIIRLFEFEKLCAVQEFKNPRNCVSGVAKRFDHQFSNYLTVLYYDVISDDLHFETERSKIDFLIQAGLATVNNHCVSAKDVIRIYREYIDHTRATIEWDIDGLVVRVNDLKKQKALGLLGENPRGIIAFKFPPIKKETKIIDVEWQIGRSGKITPVAILEPVQIGGITVKRSSLYNVDNFNNFSFNRGDTVLISRQNDVIPCVLEITKKSSDSKLEYINKCPSCGSETKIDGKFLVCDNEDCVGAALGSIMKWIVKSGIQKLGVGEKTIEALFEANLIKTPADLYRLKREDVLTLERQGERSSEKLIEAIQSKSELSLPDFIGALNIKDFSTSMVERLVEAGYDTLEKIQKLSEVPDTKDYCMPFELVNIDGIGEKKANAFIVGMNKKKNLINDLLTVVKIKGVEKKEEKKKMSGNGKLTGQSFCFTGKIDKVDDSGERYTRNRMHELVIENGGEVCDSVRSGLSFLVLADPNSSSGKTQKAKKLGVTLMSERDFFKIVGL
jgi:DNA ligase (NAD+)